MRWGHVRQRWRRHHRRQHSGDPDGKGKGRILLIASEFFSALAYVVGSIMALGALFGTVKLMYAAVSVRTREIATLHAIGYEPLPVALSVLLETTILALTGALIGAGFAWALVLAILGGLPPAIRAARRSVNEAFA